MSHRNKCPNCGSDNFIKNGNNKNINSTKQRYFCNDCRKAFQVSNTKEQYQNNLTILADNSTMTTGWI
ncbi:hypothetical protein FACS1894152_8560 [Bacilli bacterium]|nr:hypothetical protein FACS1894152_8560 [Bacilli bacterium]